VTQTPLVVPVDVHAMVVPPSLNQRYRRWTMTYQSFSDFRSPESKAFDRPGEVKSGVSVMWTLPQALRHGRENEQTGEIEFPLVPNRWMIVRWSGLSTERKAAAWLIESDYFRKKRSDMAGTSEFIDPRPSDTPKRIRIGRKHVLAQGSQWREPEDATEEPFLRALGPGNLMFSAYQPHNENVFSLHDDLSDLTEPDEALSYVVFGWYSKPKKDPLADWNRQGEDAKYFAALLNQLEWKIAGDNAPEPTAHSLYHGAVYGITPAKPPVLPVTEQSRIRIAVGNTGIDALAALVKQKAEEANDELVDQIDLLQGFHYNILTELDQPNGPDQLKKEIHDAAFGSEAGGTFWVLENKAEQGTKVSAEQCALERRWLIPLNETQKKLDHSRRLLKSLQRQLYELWWKRQYLDEQLYGDPYPNGSSPEQYDNALDPTIDGSTANQIVILQAEIVDLTANVPTASTDQSLEEAAAYFSAGKGIDETRILKAVTAKRFYQPNDPVVLVAGARNTAILEDDDDLLCRFLPQCVTEIALTNLPLTSLKSDQLHALIPRLEIGGLPDGIDLLMVESFLLDPHNATLISTGIFQQNNPAIIEKLAQCIRQTKVVKGVLPKFHQTTSWSQPWLPLYLEWEAHWVPILMNEETNKEQGWQFDGDDYTLSSLNASPYHRVIGGRSILSSGLNDSFRARLEKFVEDFPEHDGFQSLLTKIDNWDFLSQSLSGFNAQIVKRDDRAQQAPGNVRVNGKSVNILDLVGEQTDGIPNLSDTIPEPGSRESDEPFVPMRCGQFYFRRLALVDRFGQAVDLVTQQSNSTTHVRKGTGLEPSISVYPNENKRFVQLPPRFVQGVRLNFNFINPSNNSLVTPINPANPLYGWLLPNHLDRSLSVFDPAGQSLGSLAQGVTETGDIIVRWYPTPNSWALDLNVLERRHGHLGKLLNALSTQGMIAFRNFMKAIDETLWTIDPLGNRSDPYLSVLLGRPLALVRANLNFELAETALADIAWQDTFQPKASHYTKFDFSILLGKFNYRQDGLMGYFRDDQKAGEFDVFHTVHPLPRGFDQADPPFMRSISASNDLKLKINGADNCELTMLIDPRASVHAQTGLLPVTSLTLDSEFVGKALDAMYVHFKVGPLLAPGLINTTDDDIHNQAIRVPFAPRNGQWSWWEARQGEWKSKAIQHLGQEALFSDQTLTLREGYFLLENMDHESES